MQDGGLGRRRRGRRGVEIGERTSARTDVLAPLAGNVWHVCDLAACGGCGPVVVVKCELVITSDCKR